MPAVGKSRLCLLAALSALLLNACGGGGGGGGNASTGAPGAGAGGSTTSGPVVQPLTDRAASRFLEQASFGPTPDDIQHLKSVGFESWLNEQYAAPSSTYADASDSTDLSVVQAGFFKNALTAQDQLRQRVAFALGQIFVVSDAKIDSRVGIVNFQRVLLRDAFGNYRDLLKDVTLSPAMGTYLDMVDNTKADPDQGTSPNENYAREVMQLFSLGVSMLNDDGSSVLDSNGKPIPTYTQDVIEGYARALTGWTFPLKPGEVSSPFNDEYYVGVMEGHEDYHEPGTKLLLDTTLPAGQGVAKDLDSAIDSIVRHPNVGPFIGLRMIQALVKSNPSPAYVQRVARAFANNGLGVRGDMRAVIHAVLLDPEARAGDSASPGISDGKLREPVIAMTRLLRAFKVRSDGVGLNDYSAAMRQDVFNAPSVFNFYPPSYRPHGSSLLGPEFKLINSPTVAVRLNFAFDLSNQQLPAGTVPDYSDLYAAAADANALVSLLDARLTGGNASNSLKQAVVQALNAAGNDKTQRAMLALYLFAASPSFNFQG